MGCNVSRTAREQRAYEIGYGEFVIGMHLVGMKNTNNPDDSPGDKVARLDVLISEVPCDWRPRIGFGCIRGGVGDLINFWCGAWDGWHQTLRSVGQGFEWLDGSQGRQVPLWRNEVVPAPGQIHVPENAGACCEPNWPRTN